MYFALASGMKVLPLLFYPGVVFDNITRMNNLVSWVDSGRRLYCAILRCFPA